MIRKALAAVGIATAALATAALPLHAAPVDQRTASFMTSDGARLNVIEAGRPKPGQPVIAFVPGWSMPASIWAKQIEALSATHQVAALDPRGQGESSIPRRGYTTERRAEDLREFVSRYAPVVLVTWSLGSLEALYYLSKHGERDVRALVIVDSSVGEASAPERAPEPAPPPKRPAKPAPGFQQELRQDRVKALDTFLRAIFRTPQSEAYLAELREGALRMPLEASLSIFPGDRIPRERWRKAVHAFGNPLLYVVTPQYAGQAASLRANRPATRVEVFEKAGHALFVDEPERFSALLADFLARNGLTLPN